MAEIKIEKKTPIWPWIVVGILIVAVILYFAYFRTNGENNGAMEQDPIGMVTPTENANGNNVTAVTAFISYADIDATCMELHHEYAHRPL